MAKLRRSNSRPSPAKKAKSSAPAKKAQARPAVKKSHKAPARPAKAAKKPVKAPQKSAKTGKPVKPAAAAAGRAGARAAQPAAPPRRSTYADAVAMYERGMHALQAKRYRDASDVLKAVIAQFPEEKELHERAQLYIRVCERHLTPLDATPKTPEEQVYAATLAINAGALDRAIALLNAALQQDRNNDSAEYMLGVALSIKGEAQGALSHITRAVELNPDTRELVRKEADLDALRQTDEFRTLLSAPPAAPRKDKRAAPRPKAAR
ncbi:MAG: hypothetical protein NTY02_00675 [Acidobacteria bacterium]|nr:hypothetical protein [Acidobacteriota bacterium]